MKVLIDADSIVYLAGFACQKIGYVLTSEYGFAGDFKSLAEANRHLTDDTLCIQSYAYDVQPLENCLYIVKSKITKILQTCRTEDFAIYLTGDGNFRKDIATIKKYKGNRDNTGKPFHFNAIRKYLIKSFGAMVSQGVEADDAIAIDHNRLLPSDIDNKEAHHRSIISSIDKDLDTLPGWHHNWKTDEIYFVTQLEAKRNFYIQVLMGDVADNVPGLYGIGAAKATKLLDGLETEEDMYKVCLNKYKEIYPNEHVYEHWKTKETVIKSAQEMMNENMQLLRLVSN